MAVRDLRRHAGRCDQVWGDTHALGGALMRKRIFSLLASTMVVVAACGGSASPSPSSAAASQPAASTGGESSTAPSAPAASASGGQSELSAALFNTSYKPVTDATPGGTLIMGEWQP